jgi:polar amino acid transport system substrate-binding protein
VYSHRSLGALLAATLLVGACGGAGAPAAPAASGTGAAAAQGDWCSKYKFKLVHPGELTVATYGTGEPDIVVLPNQQLGGLEGGRFAAFTKDCNLKLRLFETTFASMILAVQNGEADVGTYIFYSDARSKVVYYTYPHWIADQANVFTLKSFNYTGPNSLDGKKVGTVTGFVWAPFLQQKFGASASLFPDTATGGTALLNGQIDGWVNGGTTIDIPPFKDQKDKVVGHPLDPGTWGMPASAIFNNSYNIVNCSNKDLANALNESLKRLVDGGQWAKIMADNKVPTPQQPKLESPQQGC